MRTSHRAGSPWTRTVQRPAHLRCQYVLTKEVTCGIGLAGAGTHRRVPRRRDTSPRSTASDEVVVGDAAREARRDAVAAVACPRARGRSPRRRPRSARASTRSSSRPRPRATRRSCAPGSRAGIPTFCEKPVAATLAETIDVVRGRRGVGRAGARRVPAPLRRRLPARAGGRARPASSASCTPCGPTPRPARRRTRTTSRPRGGIFRDCIVHDFDILRFVTGREVRQRLRHRRQPRARPSSPRPATSTPAPRCSPSTTAPWPCVSTTRYNGQGHDVRLEVLG